MEQGELLEGVGETTSGGGAPDESRGSVEARGPDLDDEPGAGAAVEREPAASEPIDGATGEPESREPVVFEIVSEEAPPPPPAAPAPPAGERLARARELAAEGRIDEAREVYREILAANPLSLKARNNLGALYDEAGQHELALEQFEAAEKIDPENVEVLGNLGAALGALGRYEEAERVLRRALRIEPESVDVHANLGILSFRRGLYADAEEHLRWVCERAPDHETAFFYRGEALNLLGRYDEALDALEQSVALQPYNAKAYYTLGILFDRKHLSEEAALMYRKARELSR